MAPATTGLAQNCNTNFYADGNQVYDTVCLGCTVNIQLTPSCSSESVAQAWVSVVDSTGNSNAVSLSPTNNTYYGSYSAATAGLFTIYAGDSCQGEWFSNITLAVVQLTGVSAMGAQNIDDSNYAAMVSTNPLSEVLAVAQLTPDNSSQAADLVIWQNGSNGPAYGISKTNPSQTVLTASCCNASFSIDVWVISALLKSLQFTSDHGLMTTNNSDWTDCNFLFSKPDWVASPYTNNPISQTMNTSVAVLATVNLQPAGFPFDILGDGSQGFFQFSKIGCSNAGGDCTIAMNSMTTLPGKVAINSDSIYWDLYADFGRGEPFNCLSTTSGPHTVFTTYSFPVGSSPATEARMQYICSNTLAGGYSSTNGIVNAIGPITTGSTCFRWTNGMWGHPYYTAWELLGYTNSSGQTFHGGDCFVEATLMSYELDMLGVSNSTPIRVYPCHTNWTAMVNNGPETSTNGFGNLIYYEGGSNTLNYFEGCCVYYGQYWPGLYGQPKSNAWAVLNMVTSPNTNSYTMAHQAYDGSSWGWSNAVAWPTNRPIPTN